MDFRVKSIFAIFIPLVFLFGINPILSVEDTTTQGYLNNFDSKCLTQSEYSILIGYFIKQLVMDIQVNHSSEAMETLNKISPNDDRYVLDIVAEALKQPQPKLFHLLEFINQTKIPSTTLDGMASIFTFLNNTKPTEYSSYNIGLSIPQILNWLDLQHFLRDLVDRYSDNSAIATKIAQLYNDVQDKAKSVVVNKTISSLLKYDDFNRDKVKHGTEYLNFIIASYFNDGNSTVESLIRNIELLNPFHDKTMCSSFIALYNLIESSATPNETFKMMPALKFASSKRAYRKCNVDQLKVKNGSLFEKILSENYFLLKNVHNGKFLYVKQNKRDATGRHGFIIKTVSATDSDKINWQFSAYEHSRSDRMLLTINNENFQGLNLRALPCLVHDNESIVQMQNGKYHSDDMMNDAWNVEVDDMGGERFRLQNDFTKGYLAVGIDKNEGSISLIDELNAENRDSAHWTLEAIEEE